MPDTSWNVDVDGDTHTISVQIDPESGRAAIRVDGRAAAKPMSPDDLEREVPVGSTRYLVRRLDGDTFDLDIAPVSLDPALAPSPDAPSAHEPVSKGSPLKWIILAVVVVAAGLFGRSVWNMFQYSRVPWTPYSASDGSFKVKFPAVPQEDSQSRTVNGEAWQMTLLTSGYRTHFYAVEYIDIHRVVTSLSAQSIIDDYFTRWASALNATVLSQEATKLSENPAIRFTLKIPPSADGKVPIETIAPGIVAIRNKRVFFVYAVAPEGHKSLPDLGTFVSSFELPPPPAANLKL
jgi:hypothetical protein